ncbi:SGNH/GDSL hydrolase family protein [Actinomadura sp. WMMB 499]|uniref:SGNH/GDSL hydrolase family protein n=1 Tax=Actinomadura sp. WMMB 499 TaxID=1219491 RepID=UPI00124667E4|nr:SGNH/GDSL hydrolase family protein [Actinomadura sp. WMMB 499]QFG25989.1 SGNH/GDSL hydrolase family protein [Actinomadura sp. WMMB 499]
MTSPGAWLRGLRGRLGDRLLSVAALAALLALAVFPLVALPAVRCEVFGSGCREPAPDVRADPVVARTASVTPIQAATRGGYVALGDSYSSGLGAERTVADRNPLNRCQRTSEAYYHGVANAFEFGRGSAFWACSGATTADILDGKGGERPQIDRIGRNTSLITISIGGNDVGFSKILAGCVIKLPWSDACTEQGVDIAGRMAELRQELPALIAKLRERAPRARIILMSYPKAFSEVDGAAGDNITVADQRWLNARTYELARLIKRTAAEADAGIAASGAPGSVEFVDAYSAFAGHEAGSREPYMNGLTVDLSAFKAEPRSFHPTVRGHDALAALFVEQIKKGPGRPLT